MTDQKSDGPSETDAAPAAATSPADQEAMLEQDLHRFRQAIETHVAAGKQEVTDALARHPFRATPSWEDLHTAIEAVLRFVVRGPRHFGASAPQPAPANDKELPPSAA